MAYPDRVTIYEVGPRDGLQNEPDQVPTETKIALIDRLSDVYLGPAYDDGRRCRPSSEGERCGDGADEASRGRVAILDAPQTPAAGV